MKTRFLYSVELDALILVKVITKHSNGQCVIQPLDGIATLQNLVSATELQIPDWQIPKPRFNYVDPMDVMKRDTEYWGSCVKMPTVKKGEARWLGRGAQATLDVRASESLIREPSEK